jgi:hypothetical protein
MVIVLHIDRFAQNICKWCKCFVQNDGFFRPAGGGISCRVNDRVPPVIDTTYAVQAVTAACQI